MSRPTKISSPIECHCLRRASSKLSSPRNQKARSTWLEVYFPNVRKIHREVVRASAPDKNKSHDQSNSETGKKLKSLSRYMGLSHELRENNDAKEIFKSIYEAEKTNLENFDNLNSMKLQNNLYLTLFWKEF